jgi:hypothetical protein
MLSKILLLAGALDCLTTVVGVLFFGAEERNPLMSSIVTSNIPLFMAIKISATICIWLTYVLALKTLQTHPVNNRKYTFLLKFAYGSIALFVVWAVINNIWVIVS